MKICVTSKFSGIETPSAGEFIRYVSRLCFEIPAVEKIVLNAQN